MGGLSFTVRDLGSRPLLYAGAVPSPIAAMTASGKQPPRLIVGWREWVALPELGIAAIKPKIDTGARSSSLHAFNVESFDRGGETWVRFDVHPLQRNDKSVVQAEARVLEFRHIRSSSGHQTLRPVIRTELALGERRWSVELTLAARDEMGFRMLLGREAMRGRFVVDPARSFLIGKKPGSRTTGKNTTKRKRG
jgi:hypothetical protein